MREILNKTIPILILFALSQVDLGNQSQQTLVANGSTGPILSVFDAKTTDIGTLLGGRMAVYPPCLRVGLTERAGPPRWTLDERGA